MLENLSQKIAQWEDENRKQRSQISQMYDQLFNVIDAKILKDRQTNDTISTLQSIAKDAGGSFTPVLGADNKPVSPDLQKIAYTSQKDIQDKKAAMDADFAAKGITKPENWDTMKLSEKTAYYAKAMEDQKYLDQAMIEAPDHAPALIEKFKSGKITAIQAYARAKDDAERDKENRTFNRQVALLQARIENTPSLTPAKKMSLNANIVKAKSDYQQEEGKILTIVQNGYQRNLYGNENLKGKGENGRDIIVDKPIRLEILKSVDGKQIFVRQNGGDIYSLPVKTTYDTKDKFTKGYDLKGKANMFTLKGAKAIAINQAYDYAPNGKPALIKDKMDSEAMAYTNAVTARQAKIAEMKLYQEQLGNPQEEQTDFSQNDEVYKKFQKKTGN